MRVVEILEEMAEIVEEMKNQTLDPMRVVEDQTRVEMAED
jgi:hypothetical protein